MKMGQQTCEDKIQSIIKGERSVPWDEFKKFGPWFYQIDLVDKTKNIAITIISTFQLPITSSSSGCHLSGEI